MSKNIKMLQIKHLSSPKKKGKKNKKDIVVTEANKPSITQKILNFLKKQPAPQKLEEE
jgi:hypothetical protein